MTFFLEVTLPWPPVLLNPNRRAHWRAKNEKKQKYYSDCLVLARSVVNARRPVIPADGNIPLRIEFFPPNKRPRDGDNLVASIKAGIDALAKALNVNDKRFRPVTYDFKDETPTPHGAVYIQIGVESVKKM